MQPGWQRFSRRSVRIGAVAVVILGVLALGHEHARAQLGLDTLRQVVDKAKGKGKQALPGRDVVKGKGAPNLKGPLQKNLPGRDGVANPMVKGKPGLERFGKDGLTKDRTKDLIGRDKIGKDRIGQDKFGQDKFGKDKFGKDKGVADKLGGKDKLSKDQLKDRLGKDKLGKDKLGGKDKLAQDKLGKDKLGKDGLGKDKLGKDKLGRDQLAKDKLGKDKLGKDKAGLIRSAKAMPSPIAARSRGSSGRRTRWSAARSASIIAVRSTPRGCGCRRDRSPAASDSPACRPRARRALSQPRWCFKPVPMCRGKPSTRPQAGSA